MAIAYTVVQFANEILSSLIAQLEHNLFSSSWSLCLFACATAAAAQTQTAPHVEASKAITAFGASLCQLMAARSLSLSLCATYHQSGLAMYRCSTSQFIALLSYTLRSIVRTRHTHTRCLHTPHMHKGRFPVLLPVRLSFLTAMSRAWTVRGCAPDILLVHRHYHLPIIRSATESRECGQPQKMSSSCFCSRTSYHYELGVRLPMLDARTHKTTPSWHSRASICNACRRSFAWHGHFRLPLD